MREYQSLEDHQRQGIGARFAQIYSEKVSDFQKIRAQTADADLLQMAIRGMRILIESHSNLLSDVARNKLFLILGYVEARLQMFLTLALGRHAKFVFDVVPTTTKPLCFFQVNNYLVLGDILTFGRLW